MVIPINNTIGPAIANTTKYKPHFADQTIYFHNPRLT